MTTKKEMHQRILRQYRQENGQEPVSAHAVADWAVKKGLIKPPPPVDPVARLADEFSKSWREEYRRDPETGRTYRANHAIKVSAEGKQMTLWGDIDEQPRAFMQKAFTQRREQIVGDCLQLSLDCDHFNSKHPEEEPIQIPLDFTDDVAERKLAPADAA